MSHQREIRDILPSGGDAVLQSGLSLLMSYLEKLLLVEWSKVHEFQVILVSVELLEKNPPHSKSGYLKLLYTLYKIWFVYFFLMFI